jgi:hypothetical protein
MLQIESSVMFGRFSGIGILSTNRIELLFARGGNTTHSLPPMDGGTDEMIMPRARPDSVFNIEQLWILFSAPD